MLVLAKGEFSIKKAKALKKTSIPAILIIEINFQSVFSLLLSHLNKTINKSITNKHLSWI